MDDDSKGHIDFDVGCQMLRMPRWFFISLQTCTEWPDLVLLAGTVRNLRKALSTGEAGQL